jgi:multicomponent Na+:H+ antiporter subunit C
VEIVTHFNYWIAVVVAMLGLYAVISSGNLVKKLIGLSMFQTAIFLLFITVGKIEGGTAPIIDEAYTVYSNPLPHVLILTAIVVSVATLSVGLALAVAMKREYGSVEEDDIHEQDRTSDD